MVKLRKNKMAFNVPNETKIQLLTQRIEALNLEGYQHELNKKAAEASENEEAVTRAEEAIAIIEAAIDFAQSELDSLEV
jgi:hypothetical protein